MKKFFVPFCIIRNIYLCTLNGKVIIWKMAKLKSLIGFDSFKFTSTLHPHICFCFGLIMMYRAGQIKHKIMQDIVCFGLHLLGNIQYYLSLLVLLDTCCFSFWKNAKGHLGRMSGISTINLPFSFLTHFFNYWQQINQSFQCLQCAAEERKKKVSWHFGQIEQLEKTDLVLQFRYYKRK